MDPRSEQDVGHGVRVVPGIGDGLHVRSLRLEIPWTARSGRVSGSAVLWRHRFYEAVTVNRTGGGERWILEPWPDNVAMRGVFRLDSAWIRDLADERTDLGRRHRRWWLGLAFLPFLGLVPGRLQATWQREWGFPAAAATLLSALFELAMAAAGAAHVLAQAMAGTGILPPALSWLGPLSPVLLVEAVVRLKHYGAHGEPIGSVIGLPLGLIGQLRQAPEGAEVTDSARSGEANRRPGFVATIFGTAAACMAPSDIQRRWADHLSVRPQLLTVFGAGAELVGGLVNANSASGGSVWWLILDLFFVAEGIVRFALLVLYGRPVGSVVGLALRPLLERWMPVGRWP